MNLGTSKVVPTSTLAPVVITDSVKTTGVSTTPAVTVKTVISVNNGTNGGGNVIINTKSDNISSQIANGGK